MPTPGCSSPAQLQFRCVREQESKWRLGSPDSELRIERRDLQLGGATKFERKYDITKATETFRSISRHSSPLLTWGATLIAHVISRATYKSYTSRHPWDRHQLFFQSVCVPTRPASPLKLHTSTSRISARPGRPRKAHTGPLHTQKPRPTLWDQRTGHVRVYTTRFQQNQAQTSQAYRGAHRTQTPACACTRTQP